jgi:hypothetical protein
MNTISPFDGSVLRKNKTLPTQPQFAGALRIGTSICNCAAWLNQTKKGRPYLSVRLCEQGSCSKDAIKFALWERLPPGHFETTFQASQRRLIFQARINKEARSLELSIKPASCFDSALLREAIARLPIPVLWRALALPRIVRPKCCVRSPLRDDDRNPSFSIYDNGRHFKDHGTGVAGDSFDFFKLITKLDSKTAFKRFLELAGIAPDT